MDKPRKRKKRHIIEMSDYEHKEIKIRAARLGLTVRAWLLGAIKMRKDHDKALES